MTIPYTVKEKRSKITRIYGLYFDQLVELLDICSRQNGEGYDDCHACLNKEKCQKWWRIRCNRLDSNPLSRQDLEKYKEEFETIRPR